MFYFGEWWDSPAYDDAVEVPRPVGDTCLLCHEPIAPTDSGIITPAITGKGMDWSAEHLECWLRMGLGSIAHLEGRCSCTGQEEPEDDRSWREQGRAVKAWVLARKGRLDAG